MAAIMKAVSRPPHRRVAQPKCFRVRAGTVQEKWWAPTISQRQVAEAAGLSKHQEKQSTLHHALAEQGKKSGMFADMRPADSTLPRSGVKRSSVLR
jgi:hypothetical protein